MCKASHIVRFVAVEDDLVHLGQLVDTVQDAGLASFANHDLRAYKLDGTIFDNKVTDFELTVKRLLSPITMQDCNYIRCLGLNYRDHAREANLDLPKAPILFSKPRTALADPHPGEVLIPKCAQDGSSDYEAELCVVIGRPGRDIPADRALDDVLGYTCSNDISARNLQLETSQWGFSKGLDGSCPLGPVLVTGDAIKDPGCLSIKAIHNGQTVQDGNTSDMIYDIRTQIAYLSQGTTLEKGTIILTGTPAGIGFFRNPRVVLKDGDDMRREIEKIGTLINRITYET